MVGIAVQGRSLRHAEQAAVADALLQLSEWHEAVQRQLIAPLARSREERMARQAQVAATHAWSSSPCAGREAPEAPAAPPGAPAADRRSRSRGPAWTAVAGLRRLCGGGEGWMRLCGFAGLDRRAGGWIGIWNGNGHAHTLSPALAGRRRGGFADPAVGAQAAFRWRWRRWRIRTGAGDRGGLRGAGGDVAGDGRAVADAGGCGYAAVAARRRR